MLLRIEYISLIQWHSGKGTEHEGESKLASPFTGPYLRTPFLTDPHNASHTARGLPSIFAIAVHQYIPLCQCSPRSSMVAAVTRCHRPQRMGRHEQPTVDCHICKALDS